MSGSIVIKGAREHNLKNLDVEIPRDRLIGMPVLCGTGKPSLSIDLSYVQQKSRDLQ